eukprot:2163938-Amphidinium_carterae.1
MSPKCTGAQFAKVLSGRLVTRPRATFGQTTNSSHAELQLILRTSCVGQQCGFFRYFATI